MICLPIHEGPFDIMNMHFLRNQSQASIVKILIQEVADGNTEKDISECIQLYTLLCCNIIKTFDVTTIHVIPIKI